MALPPSSAVDDGSLDLAHSMIGLGRPKGCIPVKDIKGVTAVDAMGREISLGKSAARSLSSVSRSKSLGASAAAAAGAGGGGVSGGSGGSGDGSGTSGAGGVEESDIGSALRPSDFLDDVPEPAAPSHSHAHALSVHSLSSTTSTDGTGAIGARSRALSGGGTGSTSALAGGAFTTSGGWTGGEYWFKIATHAGKDYALCAGSEGERAEWMRAISVTLQHGDLMRKAQVAMAGERMAEAVALMKLAKDWHAIMAPPRPARVTAAAAAAAGGGGSSGEGSAAAGAGGGAARGDGARDGAVGGTGAERGAGGGERFTPVFPGAVGSMGSGLRTSTPTAIKSKVTAFMATRSKAKGGPGGSGTGSAGAGDK